MMPPEHKLWSALRGGRLQGIKFVRQMVFGPHYVADFAARHHGLVIELDGDVMTNIEGVLRAILIELGRDWE